jgi:hypothetical protein
MVRLSFDIGGSQRGDAVDQWSVGFDFGGHTKLLNYGTNFYGADQIIVSALNVGGGVTANSFALGTDPFSTRSIFFTAGNAGTLNFRFGSLDEDNVGPLLDNVRLDVTSAVPEPMTWALMIFGFGAIGGVLRTSRKRPAALAA